METRRLEENTRLLGAISWSAIASGTVIALALQAVLLLLGIAFATSVGDRTAGNGFGVWMVLVQLVCIAIGAALTARLSHVASRNAGIAAGVLTWAVVLVLGMVFQPLVMTRALGNAAWSAFIGAIVSLAAAILGGAFGARMGAGSSGIAHGAIGTPRDEQDYDVGGRPVAPVH